MEDRQRLGALDHPLLSGSGRHGVAERAAPRVSNRKSGDRRRARLRGRGWRHGANTGLRRPVKWLRRASLRGS